MGIGKLIYTNLGKEDRKKRDLLDLGPIGDRTDLQERTFLYTIIRFTKSNSYKSSFATNMADSWKTKKARLGLSWWQKFNGRKNFTNLVRYWGYNWDN